MEKTTNFRFVDGADEWQFNVTYTIPSARQAIDYEREAKTILEGEDPNVALLEHGIDFLNTITVSVEGDAASVDELPADWVVDVLNGIMQRGNGRADSANS